MTSDYTKLDRSSVGVRLGLCLAAVGGTAAFPSQANAAIISFTNTVAVPQTFAGVYINFLTGVTGTSGGAVAGWDFNPYSSNSGTQLGFYWSAGSGGVSTDGGTTYGDLAPGTVIAPASTFINGINSTTGSPYRNTTGTHTLGFRFTNEGTSVVNYGYLTMTTAAGTGFPATITGWSFENSGTAITVPVPEPSTSLFAGAMAFGALGMRRWRRHERAA